MSRYHIHREHLIPAGYDSSFLVDIYIEWRRLYKVIPTTLDVRLHIRKYYHNFHRFRILQLVEVFVPCRSLKEQIDAVKADSMDQNFVIKTKRLGFTVKGKTIKNCTKICSICLESNGDSVKIELDPCGCIFHKECIHLSTKYSSLCPLCYQSINKQKEQENATKEKT